MPTVIPSIRLIRYSVAADYNDNEHQSYPIKVLAIGTNIPSEIFVYHSGKAGDPIEGDLFEAVASPNQLDEIAKNKPEPGTPYYRRQVCEFNARSAQEAEDIWTKIQEDVLELVDNYASQATLAVQAVIIADGEIAQDSLANDGTQRVYGGEAAPNGLVIAEGPALYIQDDGTVWTKPAGSIGNTGWI